jgi:hypothetical protein
MKFALTEICISRSTLIKWTLVVLFFKVFIFIFFTYYRSAEWPAKDVLKGIALYGGDSPQYYKPLESFVQGEGYQSICKMPGLLPIYYPLRGFLSVDNARVAITFFQLLMDVLATIMIAIVAGRVFGKESAFVFTVVLYGISTFISIRSLYLLSDSLNISMLIFCIYFLSNFLLYGQKKDLIVSGFFLAWSLFFRPAVIISFPFFAILLFVNDSKNLKWVFKNLFLFYVPVIISLSLWTIRNVYEFKRPLLLIAGPDECMNKFTPEQQALRNLIITMGEDFQPWSAGSGAEWFLQKKSGYKESNPFAANDFASAYNIDSLVVLKERYMEFAALPKEDAQRASIGNQIIQSANNFALSYKSENAFRYWVTNRINFIRMFLFPSRLDDLPLPAVHDMNILQKLAKAASYILLLVIHALACIAMLYFLIKRKWLWFIWGLLPFAFIVVLGYIGFIEQRYLTAAYPFMTMLAAGFLCQIIPQRVRS